MKNIVDGLPHQAHAYPTRLIRSTLCVVGLGLLATNARAVTAAQAALAQWTAPISLPIVPVSGALLANGKLELFSADAPNNITYSNSHFTYTALFDPVAGTAVATTVTAGQDMFCEATARLSDGRLLVDGGDTSGASSIYDPVANSWTAAASLNATRGYNASTPLKDGSVLTFGGSWSGGAGAKPAELFTLAGGWRSLPGISTSDASFMTADQSSFYRADNHMWLIPTANGKVLHAGPARQMHWIDVTGNGSYTSAGTRADDTDSMNGNAVMYDAGKILTLGGGTNYDNADAKSSAFVIDTTQGAATVTRIAPMAYPRLFNNSVVLPNGQVIVLGGQTHGVGFSDAYGVLPAEIFDPTTNSFTTLPPASVARNYHSIGLLLLDGRVVSAGGGLCACSGDHEDLQILSPPYLFNADGSAATRPVILSAPTTVGYGTTMSVTTDSPITSFSMIRLGATTHTVNNDQRRVALTMISSSGNTYQIAVPTNPGILLPGQWMLFAINAKGTPSIAPVVMVSGTGAPTLVNPGNVTAASGSSVSVSVVASTLSGALTYRASGLPAGLSIDPVAGTISGTPSGMGASLATIAVNNGTQTVSTDVLFSVTVPGGGTGLQAQYYSATTFTGTATARLEAPNQTYPASNTATPAAFSARWTGFLQSAVGGVAQIQGISSQGVRIWLNKQLLIDTMPGSTSASTAAMTLVANQPYPVLIEYINTTGTGTLAVNWQPPGTTGFVPVTTANLYPAFLPSTTNLALGKTATQVSTYASAIAAYAVDGNTDGVYGDNSLTHTNNNAAQDWWQVDLGQQSRVDFIELWNRTDCCANRLQNFVVFLASYDMTNSTLAQLQADATVSQSMITANSLISPTLGVPVNGTGRFVRVQLVGSNNLSLAEVQVFGVAGSAPVIAAIANQQTVIGTTASLTPSATDPASTVLSYAASGLPAGLAINASTGVISGTPTSLNTTSVTLTVTNALGFSSNASFTWTILNTIPQVTSLPAPVVASGTAVTFSPTLSAGATSTYSWNFGDGSAATAFSSTAAASHNYATPGVYTVTLTIQTADGRSSTQTLLQAVYPAGASALASSSSAIVLEARSGSSSRIWVVNQDNDSISVFDAVSFAKVAEITVGSSPRTVARASDGSMWVTNHGGGSVSIVNASSLSVSSTLALPRASQPYGIVFSPADGTAYVTLEATGQLVKLSSAGAITATLNVGTNPRHLAMSSAGDRLLVSRFISRALPGEGTATLQTVDSNGANLGGEVLVISPSTLTLTNTVVLQFSNKVDSDFQGAGIPNYLGAAAIAPNNANAWIPSKQDDIGRGTFRSGTNINFESIRSISSRIDLGSLTEDYPSRVDFSGAGIASAAVYHPTGAYLFVALETSRQVAVVDAAGKRELFRIAVGLAPRALAVSADGMKLYVDNFMGRTVSIVDLTPLVSFGQSTLIATTTASTVTTDKLSSTVLRGKQLFYDAADPRLARNSFMSCAVCHSDGTHDGRTWDFTGLGEGLRNTIALNGRAGMGEGFLHWSANFDELQDFEGQIRAFAGGSGLMANADYNTGTRSQPLGLPKAGISADLDALAAYMTSLGTFAPSPYRNADGSLTASAQLGKNVFQSANCALCHGAVPFTNSADASQLRNIGTLNAAAGTRLGATLTGIDIPTLRDVWFTGPYLHDGSASTISAAILAHSSVSLSATDLANVAEYVKEIGAEEAVAGAVQCAVDNGTCALPSGTVATVYYGANLTYINKAGLSGNVTCLPATFGSDPVPYVTKNCSYVITAIASSASGIICGQQGDLCTLPPGTVATVSYGANGNYVSKAGMSGSVSCNTAALGSSTSAASGNSCNYIVTSVALPPTATSCASENNACTIPTGAVATVMYGANGSYISKPGLTGSVACGNSTFGDPLPYYGKSCSYVITSYGTVTGSGLLGQYFGNVSLSGAPILQRTDVLNFTFAANTPPVAGVPATYFGVRWTGAVEAPVSGTAQLQTNSDDGVRVWFDGKLVIDDWLDHATTLDTASVTLVAGRRYNVMVEYHQSTSIGALQLSWQLPGSSSFAIVPAQRLYPATAPPTQNLALNKPTGASSIGFGGWPGYAVDGNTDGVYNDNSVSHTADNAANDWWQVDLGASSTISWIQIWNRTDCCSNRLQNFVMFVSTYDMANATLSQLLADSTVTARQVNASTINTTIGIPVGAVGRYVRVQLLGNNYLSLAEVQVYGASP